MGTEGRETTGWGRPTRVVIVDAEPAQREFVRLALADSPNVVIAGEAASLSAAYSLLTAGRVDVALVDLLMPEVHGFQVAHRLRHYAPDVQTVVTGDESGAHLHALARASGAAGFIERKALSAHAVCSLTQSNHLLITRGTHGTQTDQPLAA